MKAILVIDEMPTCCYDCDLWDDHSKSFRCIATGEFYDDNSIVQEWCPLKPLPKKKYVEVNDIDDLMHTEFSIEDICTKIRLDTDKIFSLGWNACLEEIEK